MFINNQLEPFASSHLSAIPLTFTPPGMPALREYPIESSVTFKEDTSSVTQKIAIGFVKEDTSSFKVASFRRILRAYEEDSEEGCFAVLCSRSVCLTFLYQLSKETNTFTFTLFWRLLKHHAYIYLSMRLMAISPLYRAEKKSC